MLALWEPLMIMDDEDPSGRECLQQHPAFELSLWQDWVQTVCGWRKIAPPTGREWDALTAKWHHDKMPLTSVDELEALRKTPNAVLSGADTT